jgi:predicted metal-dependent peptidase
MTGKVLRICQQKEQRELARDIDEAVRQGALIASKLGSGGVRNLEDLLQPQVDWREVLREFVQNTCAGSDYSTWKRPNRRYMGAGIYMPSGVSDKVGELVIAIDTSGSIGGKELTAFLSEVTSICETVNPDKVRLLYWDTAVCREEVYETNDMEGLVKSTKPAGGWRHRCRVCARVYADPRDQTTSLYRANRRSPVRWLGYMELPNSVVHTRQ